MKIRSLRIQNLRSFKDETIVLSDYACLAGANGAGKSTVLCALNIFFRETAHSATDLTCLQEEDFHRRNTDDPVTITVTFIDLSEEAQADFADYYRQGQLTVSAKATFDPQVRKAAVHQFGLRKGMSAFRLFFEGVSYGMPVVELKVIYNGLRTEYEELPAPGTKQAMIDALHAYEAEHPELSELIPSSDQFYGFSKGVGRLAKYVQWVFIPAVKDATSEQTEGKDTALGKLLGRTVQARSDFSDKVKALQVKTDTDYQALLLENQHVLSDLSTSLMGRLTQWAHPNVSLKLQWRQDEGRSVRVDEPLAEIMAGEGVFEGKISRFGHGLQRCYLLALLQEIASTGGADGPTLILGFEEPELFQHPPQAQHLSDVLQGLAEQNSQIVVCTHSPYFVSGRGFEDVRIIRKSHQYSRSTVNQTSFEDIAEVVGLATGERPLRPAGQRAKIHQALNSALNEMFFTPFLVLVEGPEDVAYITTHLHLSGRWGEWRSLGCHMVPVGGKSHMIQPIAVAKSLKTPTYVVFDSDAHAPDRSGSRTKHEKDNRALLRLCGYPSADPLPSSTYWGNGITMWRSEIGQVVAEDYGSAPWDLLREHADLKYGQAGGLSKNTLHIADMLEAAWEAHGSSQALDRLCTSILLAAKKFSEESSCAEADTELVAALSAAGAAARGITPQPNNR